MFISTILLIFLQLNNSSVTSDGVWDVISLKSVNSIELPAHAIPGSWEVINGIRIDDLKNLSKVDEAQRQTTEILAQQFLPLGIRSLGDFTLRSIDFPLNIVTVRVFIFDDVEQNHQWWKKKYQYDNWQKHYRWVEQLGMLRVDSLQINKSAMVFGDVWLTTHQLQSGSEHLDAADHIIRLLTDGKLSL